MGHEIEMHLDCWTVWIACVGTASGLGGVQRTFVVCWSRDMQNLARQADCAFILLSKIVHGKEKRRKAVAFGMNSLKSEEIREAASALY